MTLRIWLASVLLFFAWGFAMHATGLLVHEFGGHALAASVFACGIDGFKLTFFGHGQVHYAPCAAWTGVTILIADWAGLTLTTAIGVAAFVALRRRKLPPMERLLLALVAFFFLLGQLGYATAGGFHGLYDPARTARALSARGLSVLAWLPPLLLYAASAFAGARAAVDAFREQFGSRSRLQTLLQLGATLGVAGLLYFVAFRIEWSLRTDLEMRGVAVEAERVAIARHRPAPFPIEVVLLALAVAGLAAALLRRPQAAGHPAPVSRRAKRIVASAAGASVLLLAVLIGR